LGFVASWCWRPSPIRGDPIAFDPVQTKQRFMSALIVPRYIPPLFGGGPLEREQALLRNAIRHASRAVARGSW
jgi:hypothetical protein